MIDKKQIEHIAKLARIELTDEEKEKFTKELSLILDYIGQLNKVDVLKVEDQITELKNVMREDAKYKIPDTRYKLLKQAPSKKGDYIKVLKILE